MNILGLDFGTTNSVLSFYNKKLDVIEAWKMGGSDGRNYIPSILTIDENTIFIGEEAKNCLVSSIGESYSKFKILLHEDNIEKLHNYNYKNKTPKEAAKQYIETLLESYKKEQDVNSIKSIVITVPEIWLEDDMRGRATLNQIVEELGLSSSLLISEPVAAGSYFIKNYKDKHNSSFNGHLLVFDYGGGTLDVTLLKANNENIQILKRSGQGNDKDEIGKAGVLFDEKVVMQLYRDKFNKELEKNSTEYYRLVLDFEAKKIINKNLIAKSIERYNKNIALDSKVFEITSNSGVLEVKSSILVKVFDEILKQDIINSLTTIQTSFSINAVDLDNPDKFRVLMVGGFSNFYLSQKAVKDFFNSKTDSDNRFNTHLTESDITLAISKGAALIANHMVTVEKRYPITIGILYFKKDSEGKLSNYIEKVFIKDELVENTNKVFSKLNIIKAGNITLYLENDNESFKIKLNKQAEEIFPDFEDSINSWNIGFSMDINRFYYLHIKDKQGKEIVTELSDILEKYKN